ncbi:MAG: DUF2442 domain-containing protein [Algoriphagus sp.]|uniref:DUF2442 domain-containing protein n=1 Tax=Algoriphagus sp. TaxID=1872435 RepID=UPI00272EF6CA|nr:DUF2442 domain-containing protein [Algoriphagus sp.]MDP2040326.1 DUF2442 domain-containing protein [Algoriphagus sp.]MDP3473584.1 DUF2442 domain-containing protein [Algoriphagus sp.]
MVEIEFNNDDMVILKNGQRKVVDLKVVSSKLLDASEGERNLYRISPSGYGIHWPLIDEDLSIEKLLNL